MLKHGLHRYASSVLTNSAGQAGNAMPVAQEPRVACIASLGCSLPVVHLLQPRLYGATLVCSLFFSALVFSLIGAKKGLSLSMGLSLVHKDRLVALAGTILGGAACLQRAGEVRSLRRSVRNGCINVCPAPSRQRRLAMCMQHRNGLLIKSSVT